MARFRTKTKILKIPEQSEHQIQATLIDILNYKIRPAIVRMSIPNGGLRHPRVGAMLKAEGLLPGSPDLIFALEKGKVLWLEMKTKKGRLSDTQIGIHHKLEQLGHVVETAHSIDQALHILEKHGVLK